MGTETAEKALKEFCSQATTPDGKNETIDVYYDKDSGSVCVVRLLTVRTNGDEPKHYGAGVMIDLHTWQHGPRAEFEKALAMLQTDTLPENQIEEKE